MKFLGLLILILSHNWATALTLEDLDFSETLQLSDYRKAKIAQTVMAARDLNDYARRLGQEMHDNLLPQLKQVDLSTWPFTEGVSLPARDENTLVEQGDCFSEKIRRPFKAINSLTHNGSAASVAEQIREAYFFLAQQFLDLAGEVDQPFTVKHVLICTNEALGHLMSYDETTQTLRLGLSRKSSSQYDVINRYELENYFMAGVFYFPEVRKKSDVNGLIGKLARVLAVKNDHALKWKLLAWQLQNPRSTLRKSVRTQIAKKLAGFRDKMRTLLAQEDSAKPLMKYARLMLGENNSTYQILHEDLKAADQDDLRLRINEMLATSYAPLEISKMEQAILSHAARPSPVEIVDNVTGHGLFIDHKNLHVIRVAADLFSDNEYSPFIETTVPVPMKVTINHQQGGIISTRSVDIVDVQANIGNGIIEKLFFDQLPLK